MVVDLADYESTATALLHEILARSGLSQAELARRAGIPRSVLNVYLKGRREPSAEATLRIAAAAGFDVELKPRRSPVDEVRAGEILIQVLELAEALPFRPRQEIQFPPLKRLLEERGV
jgi:transcriptional regulator with XRE-family HTH domain